MALTGRIARVEAGLPDTLLWQEALRIAAKTGERPEDFFEETQAIFRKYQRYEVHRPGGMVDIDPFLRAVAEGEGLDYQELRQETRRILRNLQARERRRRK